MNLDFCWKASQKKHASRNGDDADYIILELIKGRKHVSQQANSLGAEVYIVQADVEEPVVCI